MLLLLFGIGAFAAIILGEALSEWLSRLSITPDVCMVLVLGLDALQIASLFSWITLPLFTLLFGAASALEGMEMFGSFAVSGRARMPILLAAVPTHFFLCVWGLNTAVQMKRILNGRKDAGKLIPGSLLLMLTGIAACAWLMCLLVKQ